MSRFGPRGKTLFLVDISSFIFRAFYAIRELKNSRGEPTNAIYGVGSMLGRLIEEARPEFLTVVYDSKEPSFRKETYAEYKANRSAPPDDLVPQFDRIEELVQCMGIHSIRRSGVEADDLIGTMTRRWLAEAPDHTVVIVTGDKDLLQLVCDRVLAWDTMKDVVYGEKEVEEKFQVRCDQLRDYLAMVGDSSDNIPGIPSIGPKSAVDLLKAHGTLEKVLEAAEAGKVSGKKGEVIRTHKKDALLSQELATLRMDLPLDLDLHKMQNPFGEEKVRVQESCLALLRHLELHSLLNRWSGTGPTPVKMAESVSDSGPLVAPDGAVYGEAPAAPALIAPGLRSFRTVRSDAEFQALLKDLSVASEFAYELIGSSENPRQSEIIGIAVAPSKEYGVYIPIRHRASAALDQLSEERVLAALKPFFLKSGLQKMGKNLKYSWSMLLDRGIDAKDPGIDVMIADYILDPEGKKTFDTVAMKHLQYAVLTEEQLCGKGKDRIGFDLAPLEQATRCAAESVWASLQLWQVMAPKLEAQRLMRILKEVDMPLVRTLARMEHVGVNLDVEWLARLREEFQGEMTRIEAEILKYSQGPLNLNSPKQLGHFLFEVLGLPPQSKTKTGYSTDASVLEALAEMHPAPRLILEYREIAKLQGTYVEPLPEMREKDGRIHASFHQTVTATGRLSSSDPNLQNIPVRSERGLRIRRAFIPAPGNVLVSADYSQIELRILAQMSGDRDLLASFQKDEDVHRRTASEIYGVAPEAVTSEQRTVAKAINFGLMYGKSAFGLAAELGISRTEAKEMIERYFQRYSGVKRFLDRLIENAHETGTVSTLMGRRRELRDIRGKNPMLRAAAERMAMNTPIQGTAADLMKLAMIRVERELEQQGLRSRLILQVHDEVVLDCPPEEVEEVKKLVVGCMENAFEGVVKLDLPLRVNVESGSNWMEL